MYSVKFNPYYRRLVRFMTAHFPVMMAKARYRKMFGKPLDLKNPQDINEKILWLSLYSDTTLWSRLADKYAVRGYVEEKGLKDCLVKLYGKYDNVEDIEWDSLPQSFVIKNNQGSGTVMVVQDKSNLDVKEVKSLLERWLKQHQGFETTEFHYTRIKPCIIIEEMLDSSTQENSTTLIDYKVWCFNGKAYYIWACSNRVGEATNVATFDMDWNYLPDVSVFDNHYRRMNPVLTKPACLHELINVAETLSEGIPVVRVDLYIVNNKVYFGEMTFTSFGGTMNFYTPDFLLKMGQIIDTSGVKKQKVNKPIKIK